MDIVPDDTHPKIESISAVTLVVSEMSRSVEFYRQFGFEIRYRLEDPGFTSFFVGEGFLNLQASSQEGVGFESWGRVVFYVSDVDALYEQVLILGLNPSFPPRDASWGERYFHVSDPDGHELSFAKLL